MTKYMTVVKLNPDKSKTLVQINLDDVDFIESAKKELIYYIGNEKFFQITNKSQLEEFLIHEGFDSLDRPNLVNLKNIKKFDEKYGKVFFVESPDKTSVFATVAKIKYEFVKNIIQRIVAHNNDTTQNIGINSNKVKLILQELKNKI